MRAACIAVALSVFVSPAFADTGSAIEWNQTNDRLSNGSANWRSEELRWSAQLAPRNSVDATLRHASRFGLSDTQVEVNLALPLSQALSGALMASHSGTHRFLPQSDLGASLQYEFAPAWLVTGGAGRTEYDKASITKTMFGVEHYFSAFRLALAWRPSRTGGVAADGADIRLDYYYADRDFFGVQASSGKEAGNIDGRGVIVSSVSSVGVTGRHGLTRNWTLRYGVERVKQGDFYNRTGIRLGAQYAF